MKIVSEKQMNKNLKESILFIGNGLFLEFLNKYDINDCFKNYFNKLEEKWKLMVTNNEYNLENYLKQDISSVIIYLLNTNNLHKLNKIDYKKIENFNINKINVLNKLEFLFKNNKEKIEHFKLLDYIDNLAITKNQNDIIFKITRTKENIQKFNTQKYSEWHWNKNEFWNKYKNIYIFLIKDWIFQNKNQNNSYKLNIYKNYLNKMNINNIYSINFFSIWQIFNKDIDSNKELNKESFIHLKNIKYPMSFFDNFRYLNDSDYYSGKSDIYLNDLEKEENYQNLFPKLNSKIDQIKNIVLLGIRKEDKLYELIQKLIKNNNKIKIIFYCYSDEDFKNYKKIKKEYFSQIKSGNIFYYNAQEFWKGNFEIKYKLNKNI